MPGPLELCRIIVEFDIAQLGENQTSRLHWGTKTSRKNTAKLLANVAWIKAGRPKVGEEHWPVTVVPVVRRGRLMDLQNIHGAAKVLIDALFVGAILPDDGPRYFIPGAPKQITGKMYKGKETVEFVVYSGKVIE